MTRAEIENKIATILSDITRKPLSDFTPDAKLDDLGIESLDRVEISIGIETEFNIVAKDEEIEDLATVGEIAAYVEKTIAA